MPATTAGVRRGCHRRAPTANAVDECRTRSGPPPERGLYATKGSSGSGSPDSTSPQISFPLGRHSTQRDSSHIETSGCSSSAKSASAGVPPATDRFPSRRTRVTKLLIAHAACDDEPHRWDVGRCLLALSVDGRNVAVVQAVLAQGVTTRRWSCVSQKSSRSRWPTICNQRYAGISRAGRRCRGGRCGGAARRAGSLQARRADRAAIVP